MKFKNENDKFEWEVLELTEEDYSKKILLLKPFLESSNSLFDYATAREKWNESTNRKRFKDRILNSLDILKKDNFTYSDVLEIYITLSSIATHIFIELQYYEPNREALKEFLKTTEIFLNNYSEILASFNRIILKPNILNNYKNQLEEIFEYYKDF